MPPLDDRADMRVYAKTDDLMIRIMHKLDIPVSIFSLRRQLVVQVEKQAKERYQVKMHGIDVEETPVSFPPSVKLKYSRRVVRSEPFVISIRDDLQYGSQLIGKLEFMRHYGEPNLVIVHGYNGEAEQRSLYLLEYNPHNGAWRTAKQDSFT